MVSRYVRRLVRGAAGLLLGLVSAMGAGAQDRYVAERKEMLEEVARTARETRHETGRAALSERVMQALARVPRHRLIPKGEEASAYQNRPLAIGHGQTISQPFIVGLMTDLLDVKPGEKVLEVGTGSGYQAAVLAELGAKVYTIEIVEPLGRQAAAQLAALGYRSIETRIGDGYRGWPEQVPFDAIIVTAAPSEVPPALIEQLKTGGRLVIPLGGPRGGQTLYLMEKQSDATLTRREILGVRFVPFTGVAEKKVSRWTAERRRLWAHTRSSTRSQPLSLLSIPGLNSARSRSMRTQLRSERDTRYKNIAA